MGVDTIEINFNIIYFCTNIWKNGKIDIINNKKEN